MLDVHGKPFLEYLVEMLQTQGFRHVLLLLGYLPDVIQDYFGDGRRWGLRVDYSISSVENETGARIKAAGPLLDDSFLLMYCDNYWPLQIERMWPRFVAARVPAMLTVYTNADRYTTNGVRLDPDGYVVAYDKSRTQRDLQGVEIGYALLRRSVLDLLPPDNVSFEATVYPQLAGQHRLLAYPTDHRYYSIGSWDRLALTREFLARRPAIFLDRDGVLNVRPPVAQYVCSWREFEWLPGAREALRWLREAGYRVIVVSNQPGVARGALTEAALTDIHRRMTRDAVDAGGCIDAIYYCPHNWDEGCQCRKPRPGLLFQAQRDYSLDLSRTVFIGDDSRDQEAAHAAGCPSILLQQGETLRDVVHRLLRVDGGESTASSVGDSARPRVIEEGARR
jgi:D-glycero-D-manno-heptose 1,7-bisphosphate phosphatase